MDYIKGGIIGLLTILTISIGTAPAPVTQKEVTFNISILRDASISISALCTNGSPDALQFRPSINLISEDEWALPINQCDEAATVGHWNIKNEGNINLNLSMTLQNELPTGVTTQVGTVLTPYAVESYNSIINGTPTKIGTITKGQTVNYFQRMAANENALGGDGQENNKIIITSAP